MDRYAEFPSGYARVIARDQYQGKIGKVICEEAEASGVWFTLELDGLEIMFERHELISCPAPKADA